MLIRLVLRSSRSMSFAAIVFFLVPSLLSQAITHETTTTNEQLKGWLQSGDPRQVAWAATLAREHKDASFIALLPEWLKQSSVIRDYTYSPEPDDSRAYDAVLDALIRGSDQQLVDPDVIRSLGGKYPVQAFLLLERLPYDQQLPVLKEWFSTSNLGIWRSMLAHLAAMRLAQWAVPVPGFAARVLNESEEHLTVELRATATEDEALGAWGACGDSIFRPPAPGWPVIYVPAVEESQNSTTGVTLINLDDDRVSYRWVEENSPGGTCYAVRGLDQLARHKIVAHWLGTTENGMKWQLSKRVTVVWKNRDAFDLSLGRLLEEEEKNFGSETDHLVQSGLLTKDEAAWDRPKIVVRVVCHMNPCPIDGIRKDDGPDMMWLPFV